MKPLAIYRHGERTDKDFQAGKLNDVREWCKKVRQLGAVVGVGTRDAARLIKSYKSLGFILPGADTDSLEKASAIVFAACSTTGASTAPSAAPSDGGPGGSYENWVPDEAKLAAAKEELLKEK
mgnify:CR=1 FL=1